MPQASRNTVRMGARQRGTIRVHQIGTESTCSVVGDDRKVYQKKTPCFVRVIYKKTRCVT